MRFDSYHPAINLIYFIVTIGCTIWFRHPVYALISYVCAFLYSVKLSGLKALIFNIYQVIANVIAWGLVAPVFDILIYAEPTNKVFIQGLFAGLANIVTTAIIGTLLCFAYSKTRPQAGSLKKE